MFQGQFGIFILKVRKAIHNTMVYHSIAIGKIFRMLLRFAKYVIGLDLG